MHTIPSGLLNQNIEFFTDLETKSVFALQNGSVINFEAFPETLKLFVWHKISTDAPKLKALTYLAGPNRDLIIHQYLLCLYGGFDNQPDMVNGRLLQPEYWACPYRGNCPHEGIICDRLRTDTGAYLTSREIEVLRLIATGALDKEIAWELKISVNTVPMHTKNLRIKTGLFRKADLTRFAILKNLI